MIKKATVISILSLLTIPLVAADLSQTFSNVWSGILSIGNLSFLGISDGSLVVGFTRLMIWLLMFTIFFAVITGLGGKSGTAPMSFFSRGQAGVIAAVIATIAAVFLPANVLLATGAGWATAIALILIGGPVVGIAYLLWRYPGEGNETRFTILVKLLLCLLLFWILAAMKYHVSVL